MMRLWWSCFKFLLCLRLFKNVSVSETLQFQSTSNSITANMHSCTQAFTPITPCMFWIDHTLQIARNVMYSYFWKVFHNTRTSLHRYIATTCMDEPYYNLFLQEILFSNKKLFKCVVFPTFFDILFHYCYMKKTSLWRNFRNTTNNLLLLHEPWPNCTTAVSPTFEHSSYSSSHGGVINPIYDWDVSKPHMQNLQAHIFFSYCSVMLRFRSYDDILNLNFKQEYLLINALYNGLLVDTTEVRRSLFCEIGITVQYLKLRILFICH